MTTYHGRRDRMGNAHVWIRMEDGRTRPLPLRLNWYNHSPTGFEWGYGGSGPAQLALAILADVLHNKDRAIRLHQNFKWKFIGGIKRDAEWTITRDQVVAWVKEQPETET